MPISETRFKKKLFGGEVQFIIYSEADPYKIENIIKKAYEEALRLQKVFSFFDEESELSILNRKRKMIVSEELFNVIKRALKFSTLTKGKYNVGLGKNITERKTKKELTAVDANYKDIKLDSKTKEVYLKSQGIKIDLGSIAKGYITDKMGEFLRSCGIENFLIDSRGDILVSGENFHIIEVQHPRKEEKTILPLKIKNEGVATSGDYMQYHKNFENSHILNRSNFISVTVIAPTLELADVCATAIFVSDKRSLKKILKKNKIKVMTIDKNLNTEFFNGIEELIYGY